MFSVFNDFPPPSSVLCFKDFCICGGRPLLVDTSSGPRGDQGPSEVRAPGPCSKGRPSDARETAVSFQNLKASWLT